MEVRIISERYNPLLKRKEVVFEVRHEQTKGTPPRFEVRTKLAEMLKTKLEQVYVKKMETKTGTMIALGEANAYDDVEQAMLIEPKYVIERNTPKKEEAKEEAKVEEEKPEKPVEEAKEAEKAEEPKQPSGKEEKEE